MTRMLTEREQNKLKIIDEEIYDTYHDPNNKNVLPMVIFFSVIAIIFKGALTYEIIIWMSYWLYCTYKNNKWANLERNIQERQFLINYREKFINQNPSLYEFSQLNNTNKVKTVSKPDTSKNNDIIKNGKINEDRIKSLLSQEVLSNIPDSSTKIIIRKILFDNDNNINWEKVQQTILEFMPELNLKY